MDTPLHGIVHERFNVYDGVLSFKLSLGNISMFSPSESSSQILEMSRASCWLRYRKDRAIDLSLHAGGAYGNGLYYTHILDLYVPEAFEYWIMGKAVFEIGESLLLKTQLYFNSSKADLHPRINIQAMDIWIFDAPDFTIQYPVLDGQIQLDIQAMDDLLVIAGANFRYVYLESDFYDPSELSEIRGAGFVQINWILFNAIQFTGGVRLDVSKEMENALSPRAALVYRPWSNHAFRLSYGLAFRKPSLYEGRAHPSVEDYNPAIPEIVDKAKTQMGNEELVNEKVHSFEAGWRANFLGEKLHTSVDVFFNIYQDVISFTLDIPLRMGLPDIVASTFRYENEDSDINAVGAEAEMSWYPSEKWKFWCNLSFRKLMSESDNPAPDKDESVGHVTVGGRYLPPSGLLVDMAIHYVSSYHLTIPDPDNVFDPPVYYEMGNNFMLIGRLGYRLNISEIQMIEGGLTIRTPLGLDFREYPGHPMAHTPLSLSASDFGGDRITRLIQFYLRWSY